MEFREQVKTAHGLNITIGEKELSMLEFSKPQTIQCIMLVIDYAYYLPSLFMFLTYCLLLFVPIRFFAVSYTLIMIGVFSFFRLISYISSIYKLSFLDAVISLYISLHAFLITEILVLLSSWLVFHSFIYAILYFVLEIVLMIIELSIKTNNKLAKNIIHAFSDFH